MPDPMWFGDREILIVQGVTESVSKAARNIGSIFEDVNVMQSTAEIMPAGKVASGVVPIRSLANGFNLGPPSAKAAHDDDLPGIDSFANTEHA